MRIKNILLAAALILPALALATPSIADAADFKGQFKFTSKAPKEDIFGTGKGKADLTIDLSDLTKLRGTITVPIATMETGNASRDEHMQGSDWLDAKAYPNITFEITGVEVKETSEKNGVKAANVNVTGKFTLHGVTTTMTAPATLKWKADGKTKITTKFSIKLADYKVTGSSGIVGSKVGATIACEATLIGAAR